MVSKDRHNIFGLESMCQGDQILKTKKRDTFTNDV
jgi:hypothetical protein